MHLIYNRYTESHLQINQSNLCLDVWIIIHKMYFKDIIPETIPHLCMWDHVIFSIACFFVQLLDFYVSVHT